MLDSPTVWLLHEPRSQLDLSDARSFGTVLPVLPSSMNPSLTPGPALAMMRRLFQQQYREGDTLLYAPADPIVPLLAGLTLASIGRARQPLRWLRWERARYRDEKTGRLIEPKPGQAAGFYVPVTIETDALRPAQKGVFAKEDK